MTKKVDPMNLPIVQAMLDSLTRCAFLLQAIAGGDHKALLNAEDAALEAARVLRGAGMDEEWMEDVLNREEVPTD